MLKVSRFYWFHYALAFIACGCSLTHHSASGSGPVLAQAPLHIKLADTQTGNFYQLAVTAPLSATQAWLCLAAVSAPCTPSTTGVIALQLGHANTTTLSVFVLSNPLPIATGSRITAIAANALGQVFAQEQVSLRARGASDPLPTTTTNSLSPPSNLGAPRPIKGVNVAYDYPGTFTRLSPNAAVVRMSIQTGVLKGKTLLHLQGQLHSLKNSQTAVPVDVTGSADANGVVEFILTGLSPETVYRLDSVSLSDAQSNTATESVKDSYYTATGGSDNLAQGRRMMAMRAISEAYDWDHDNYDASKNYAAEGGWCDRFYSWVANDVTTLKYPDYSPNWYESNHATASGAQIKTLAARESLSGDMVRYDGLFQGHHTFMILSYDADTDKVFTIEGNYNDRVERSERPIESSWELGHLNQSLIK